MTTTTLAQRLESSAVDDETLQSTYGPMRALVKEILGVVPSAGSYLEIWPPAFRSYNLLVPNLLNLPAMLLPGFGAPKDMVGLGVYVSSRAAKCMYCSAHTCSFASRRGAGPLAITGMERTPAERSIADLAQGIASVPHSVTREKVEAVSDHFTPSQSEWIVLGMVMMGFLNKATDALGLRLEEQSIKDASGLIAPTGWTPGKHNWNSSTNTKDEADEDTTNALPPTDTLGTYLRIFMHGPSAARLEATWLKDVPRDPAKARSWLKDETGYDEPLLEQFTVGRRHVPRALAGIMRENLSSDDRTNIGVAEKAMIALNFAVYLDNRHLIGRAEALMEAHEVDREQVAKMGGKRWEVLSELAAAFFPSPCNISDELADQAVQSLEAAEIIELVTWISVLQMWHRWELYVSHK